ncbi:MAG: 50S ribosomal protein L4 [Gemmatimonadota bacterium]|nr:50S ribosomal protein L4 [Gemmatimonadota bacterium]
MKQITVLNQNGEEKGEITLPESYFAAPVSEGAVYYTVNALLTNRRQGNASTKGRSEVVASTAKPWRQKGTGRARAGMRSSPIWRGGGTTFGPKPKDYDVRLPKKVRRAALLSAFSDKAGQEGSIAVVENIEFTEPKTKRMAEVLKTLDAAGRRVLILCDGYKPMVLKSARNIPLVVVKPFTECNAYDVMLADKLIIEKNAIKRLEQSSNEGTIQDSKAAPAD